VSDPRQKVPGGVTRLDQEASGTHGWLVRWQRGGVRGSRFFSDGLWGGREAALDRALRFRERLVAKAGRRDEARGASSSSHTGPGARNRSGVVGVARVVQRSAAGMEYTFWQASWTRPDGARETVRFSVLKYGEEDAFARACRARREALG